MLKKSRYSKFIEKNGNYYLFNSLSRSCIKILKDEVNKVKRILSYENHVIGEEKEYQDILIKNGFVIEHTIDELSRLEFMYNSSFFNTSSISLVMVPTLKCNFKCSYCFEEGHKHTEPKKEYFEIMKKFAEKNFKYKKKVQISLFGGEPLLKKDETFNFLDYVLDKKIDYKFDLTTHITTNGYLLDNETITQLISKYHCKSLQVTLDGKKETHDKIRILHNNGKTFDVIVKNFKNAVNYSIKNEKELVFFLRINLLNQSLSDIESIFKLFNEIERPKITTVIRPVYNTRCFDNTNSNNNSDLKKFYNMAKKYNFKVIKHTYYLQHCEAGGGINFLHLNPDLKVWKCINDMSVNYSCIGYIDNKGDLIINSENLLNVFNKSNPFKDEKCRNCYNLPICYGGCPLFYEKNKERQCPSEDLLIAPYLYS